MKEIATDPEVVSNKVMAMITDQTQPALQSDQWPPLTAEDDVLLNASQRKAICDLSPPVEIIQGPPGTGKSETALGIITMRTGSPGQVAADDGTQ